MHKILAIDDDLYILEIYKEIFCPPDFELRVAEDAVSGMTVFADFKPELVFLDVDIPAGGGEKVYDRIRGVFLHGVPIIFYTGAPELIQRFSGSPQVAIIKKPASNDVILERAKSLLGVA